MQQPFSLDPKRQTLDPLVIAKDAFLTWVVVTPLKTKASLKKRHETKTFCENL